MFGSKTEKSSNTSGMPVSANLSNSIVEGTQIEGNIQAANDIRIDGVLKGNLECRGRVIIGPQGRVEGDVSCINAIIEGTHTGNLSVRELLAIKETGVVSGDIITEKLLVQGGALLNGTCSMSGQKLTSLLKNE
jgi:cytoskeletal protein CcmA (bactofilin family)